MGRGHVKVVIVLSGLGIGQESIQETSHILLGSGVVIGPISKGSQVDCAVGVCLFGGQVGDLLQLGKIGHRTVPGMGQFPGRDIRLVPDDPMIDPTGVTGNDLADKSGPTVRQVMMGQP